mgnify:CR=1 FL=1
MAPVVPLVLVEKVEMNTKYEELAKKYEEKRFVLLVAEAKLYSLNELIQNHVDNLQKEIDVLKYQHTMGKGMVRCILSRHKQKMKQMITESLNEGWKMWSKEVAKLQLLRAGHESQKKQGQGYFKMDEEAIRTVQQELYPMIYLS